METKHLACRAALTGFGGALLVALAVGPAMAGQGYDMKQHPLRGDFPATTHTSASVTPAQAAEARLGAGGDQVAKAGDWLRGDFPKASATQLKPVATAASGIGDIWKCSLDQASTVPTKIGTTQAVMRVIKLVQ